MCEEKIERDKEGERIHYYNNIIIMTCVFVYLCMCMLDYLVADYD